MEPLPTIEFETITPRLAENYLVENTANRRVRKRNVDKLARDITDGNYLVTGDAIRFDWNGVLVDGQHRLLAIISAGQPVTTLVIRGLNPRVRDVIDAGTKRSAADALGFNDVSVNETTVAAAIRLLIGIEKGIVTTTTSRMPDLTNSEIVDWYVENGGLIEEHAAMARMWTRDPSTRNINCRPGVLAAALYTFSQVDPEQAVKFFTDMDNLSLEGPIDPRKVLLARLKVADSRTPAPELFFYLVRTWNAWRAGEHIKMLKASNVYGPAKIPTAK